MTVIRTPAVKAVPLMLVVCTRSNDDTGITDELRHERDPSVAQIAAQSPSMMLQHMEVLVKTMYTQLSENTGSQW